MSNQDPWGKPGQTNSQDKPSGHTDERNSGAKKEQQSPPDLEEVFGNLLKKLGNKSGNSSNQTGNPFPFGKLLPVAGLLGVIIWGASGLYTIKEAERGVVTRFGELNSIVQPGLNWKPTFIDDVQAVNVEEVKELRTQGAMLTKDENMVKVEMTVQYRVQDPAKFLFNVKNPKDSLTQATDSALRYTIGNMLMDEILTTGRAVVREKTWNALNEIIKPYEMGLEVMDVNFQSARPPEEVKDAFDDAIKAQEDEQRYIREAEAYAREKEPIARGDAKRIVEQATAYKEQVVLEAQGEVERFKHLLPEFKMAPDLMRERLYIQTMEKIMANTPKVMVENANSLNLLPLDKLLGNRNSGAIPESAGQNLESFSRVAPNAQPNNSVAPSHSASAQTELRQDRQPELRQGRFN